MARDSLRRFQSSTSIFLEFCHKRSHPIHSQALKEQQLLPSSTPPPLCERFAMESGRSMSAPHVTGIAALIKQKFPHFTPAAIASALSTTASLTDRKGGPINQTRVKSYSNPRNAF
ncbi:hypothetical protein YC2023_109274 [Brassica napus]